MDTIIRISEAAVIALHAVDFIAKSDGNPCSTRHVASELGVSYNHLVKVMQRLTRAGLLLPGDRRAASFSQKRRKPENCGTFLKPSTERCPFQTV